MGEVCEFAGGCGAMAEEGLEKLHHGGDDDRMLPLLGEGVVIFGVVGFYSAEVADDASAE